MTDLQAATGGESHLCHVQFVRALSGYRQDFIADS
jgi:hypothetical protein